MSSNEERRKQAEAKIEQVLDIYYSGAYESTGKFLKDYNINPSTFWAYIKRKNLPSLRHTTRKYTMNEDYFVDINTEEKAYWLGFLQCDGYIKDTGIEISLCYADIEHLEKLKKAIEYTGKISEKTVANKYKACRMIMTSKKLVEPFINVGLDKFKSATMELLIKHDNPLFKHYIRGIIDANANISLRKYTNTINVNCILTSGSEKFAKAFVNEMCLYCNNSSAVRLIKHSDTVYGCLLHKVAYMKLFEESYKNACISLNRKQEKANAVLYGSTENI